MADGSNVEFLERAFAALNDGDPYVFLDVYAEDIELYVPAATELDSGLYAGAEAVNRWFGNQFAQWEDARWEVERMVAWGPHVTVFGRWRGRGRRSGLPFASVWLGVYTFDDGRLVHIAHLGATETSSLDAGTRVRPAS